MSAAFSRGFEEGVLRESMGKVRRLAKPLGSLCQSPIEVQFGAAFLFLAHIANRDCAIISGDSNSYREFALAPQFQIEKHRVDFVACFKEIDQEPVLAVVECDGREFHYANREQIERDRARDKDLEGLGYRVFRFPGTQLDSDPFGAAGDVIIWLASRNGQTK